MPICKQSGIRHLVRAWGLEQEWESFMLSLDAESGLNDAATKFAVSSMSWANLGPQSLGKPLGLAGGH